ncbi:phosphoglycolate phosphatase [Pseudoxanthomonas broegbernensis]|uniref:Phosphoglycolate phosphatase n=2 Tax=Pseudoxanthomonas broegbernensis TaxID=83619 RepID=A0A7V8GPG1_9GAMM|nr:phosphoglycolate phosphatase [Pseudoxanthomonas broegbernensis]KAF1687658.1 phosphoglycolate phosphatase [Pseudoxanthomonas broegbernensis]MBB6064684.1 phosphoglycolate phosphatase [Pseudoxanthomonas broegbernensis]
MDRRASAPRFPRVALFDLDGTLLDSAPDMVVTANRMLAARDRPPVGLALLRQHVSKGARAMVAAAFPELDEAGRDALVPEFLATYRQELGRHSALFDDVAAMLQALEDDGARWGIITNKAEYLARDVVAGLEWQRRCAVLVGGDTYAEKKPHPLPLLEAARSLGVDPGECVYVGDDERDVVAARAAGMPSIAVTWGYRLDGDDPQAWRADAMAYRPGELLDPAAWPRRPGG